MDDQVEQKLEIFFSQYKTSNFHRGTVLIQIEDDPQGVYFIKEGVIRMYTISALGEELTINTFKPSAFFPVGWALNNTPINHYYEAVTDVIVSKAPKEDFLNLLEKEPAIVMDLLKRIYRGLEGFMERMASLMSGTARNKLLIVLLIYLKRFGVKEGSHTTVSLKLTEKEIASQSGLARETVSREIQKLKEKGLIAFDKNRLSVADITLLEAELNYI